MSANDPKRTFTRERALHRRQKRPPRNAGGNARLNLGPRESFVNLGPWRASMNPLQQKAYDAVSAALPFAVDPAKITVEPGLSYLPSPIKLHDYAVGAMAAFGSVVEHLGALRGLPAQTMKVNRRLCGFHLNELQV